MMQAHGCLRIGKSDFGVNAARNSMVIEYINSLAEKGRIPPGTCDT